MLQWHLPDLKLLTNTRDNVYYLFIVLILDIESSEDNMFDDEISDENNLTHELPKEKLTGKQDL